MCEAMHIWASNRSLAAESTGAETHERLRLQLCHSVSQHPKHCVPREQEPLLDFERSDPQARSSVVLHTMGLLAALRRRSLAATAASASHEVLAAIAISVAREVRRCSCHYFIV